MRRAANETEESLDARSRDVRETVEWILERWRELDDMLEGDVVPDIMRRFAKGDRGVALRRISARVKDPID